MSDIFDPVLAVASQHVGVDRWDDLLNHVAPTYGVPPNLVKAHMLYESGGDPRIISADYGYGLMQITSGVVDGRYRGADILDPFTNIKVACRDFIAPSMRIFPGNLDAVIASYNAGTSAVSSAIAHGRDLTQVTFASWYIPRVRDAYAWFNGVSHGQAA